MIEEIKNPLPVIEYFLNLQETTNIENKDVENNTIKRYANAGLQKYFEELAEKKKRELKNIGDVSFINDISLVREFAERQCLDYTLSEALLIAFFEQLKEQLMDGKIIFLDNIGKFYVMAPYRNEKAEFSMPSPDQGCNPKLKPLYANRTYNSARVRKEREEKKNKA